MSTQRELEGLIAVLRAGGVRRFAGFGVEVELQDEPTGNSRAATAAVRDTVPASPPGPASAGSAGSGSAGSAGSSDDEWAETMYGSSLPMQRGERMPRIGDELDGEPAHAVARGAAGSDDGSDDDSDDGEAA